MSSEAVSGLFAISGPFAISGLFIQPRYQAQPSPEHGLRPLTT